MVCQVIEREVRWGGGGMSLQQSCYLSIDWSINSYRLLSGRSRDILGPRQLMGPVGDSLLLPQPDAQNFVLQSPNWVLGPSQTLPPIHVLDLCCLPPPQLAEQLLQAPHGPQVAETESEVRKQHHPIASINQ